ncbi:bacterial extracellular solute-binding family protein [Candidatus Phytoplasma oryzae]|uniref:Bacterial extracellular solute-binding family protein n=1 Tax=Candidatus Phytoplasma oryzae TaxID=203274 RepID=A0A139JQN0_9MOLU|nr:bacterial extracellular solute-binding family protein [Candidatus Phytoplasma oryzae]KXT29348.1 bacterial extracellular solute-binding family protein [Candidatus Phytoplasma oryzae]
MFFNWGEYIDPNIIEKYNKQSSRFVIKSSFFSSNELAINKIKSGNKYDIAILSEYAIEQLKDDFLETIIFEKITENTNKTKKFQDLISRYSKFDSTLSIPYFWGKIGLLYNKKKVNKDQIVQWRNLVKDDHYRIALYNNSFEGIFIGLKAINGDISGNNEEDIKKAQNWLLQLKKQNSNLSFVTDQILDYMRIPNEERYDISLVYSGDARFLMKQNPNLEYYDFSQEENDDNKGSNIWLDSLVLLKGSSQEGAYDFINFLLKKENIEQNIIFTQYDSPYIDFWQKKNSPLNLNINSYDSFYYFNEKNKKKITDAWNYVYSFPRPQDNYLFLFSFLILLLFLFINFFL